jgi:hypothetical protein
MANESTYFDETESLADISEAMLKEAQMVLEPGGCTVGWGRERPSDIRDLTPRSSRVGGDVRGR